MSRCANMQMKNRSPAHLHICILKEVFVRFMCLKSGTPDWGMKQPGTPDWSVKHLDWGMEQFSWGMEHLIGEWNTMKHCQYFGTKKSVDGSISCFCY
jgi:hypothetical protein